MSSKVIVFAILIMAYSVSVYAQNITAGSMSRDYMRKKESERIQKRITAQRESRPKITARRLKKLPKRLQTITPEEIILNHNIPAIIEYDEKALNEIVYEYNKKELTFNDLEELCDRINDVLQDDRFTVYVPRQTRIEEVLYINICFDNE